MEPGVEQPIITKHQAEVFRALPSGVVFQDARGVIVEANPAAERILGRSIDQMRGLTSQDDTWGTINENGSPLEGKDHPAMVALRTGEAVPPTRMGILRPGEKEHRWLQVTAFPLFDSSPQPILAFAIFEDVTDQVRAERALRASEERYRSIVDSSPMGLHAYRLEPDGSLVFAAANAAADRLTGASCQNYVGMTIEQAFPPLAQTEIPDAYRRVCRTGEPWHTDQVIYQDDKITGAFSVHAFRTGPNTMAVLFLEITERKRAEQALRQSEARYRALVDASPDAICVVSPDGRIQQANESMAVFHGLPNADALKGRLGFELVAACERDRAGAVLADGVRTGAFGPEVFRLVRGNSEFVGEIAGAALRDDDGKVASFVIVCRDVTARHRAVALTRVQRDLATRLASAISIGEALSLCVEAAVDATPVDRGMAVIWNESGAAEVLAKTPVPALENAVNQLRDDVRVLSALGRGQHLFYDTTGVESLLGRDTGMLALAVLPVVHDLRLCAMLVLSSSNACAFQADDRVVLESVAAQFRSCFGRLAATRDQAKLAMLIESSASAIGIVRPDGTLGYLNREARELIGASSDGALPTREPGALLGEDSARMLERTVAIAREKNRISGEGEVRHPVTREPIHVVFQAFKLPSSDDIAVVLSDVTAHRRAEAALLEAERRAAKERAELQEQLAQSQKMEAIGRLAGGIAHDFNNLLTGINGYSELLLLQIPDGAPERNDIIEIRKAAQRAASLTAQLLAFSRRQIISPKILDLNEVVIDSHRMLARIIGEDIELRFCPGSELWHVRVDPAQVDQILVNLATNSRDAMPDGGRLTIETQNVIVNEAYADRYPDAEAGEYVLLAISDDGAGMDLTVQERAFEPFFSTKEVGRGTGLGLSTVFGIVRQSNGFINLYSEPGVGTTVKVYFPRVLGDSTAPRKRARASLPMGEETVLVVEDEAIVRNLALRMLERQGYRVLTALSGIEACSLADDEVAGIDLLVTDVVMPKLNGLQTYGRLRERQPKLRVLYMSGYTENAIAHHGVLKPGTHFIQKPFTSETLLTAVRRALDETSTE